MPSDGQMRVPTNRFLADASAHTRPVNFIESASKNAISVLIIMFNSQIAQGLHVSNLRQLRIVQQLKRFPFLFSFKNRKRRKASSFP